MQRTKWIDRTFTFDFPVGLLPNILERLRGTSPRLKEIALSLSDEHGRRKPDNKWSIKEHIGHLTDLEDIHLGRIDDFTAQCKALRAADMTNAQTTEARHNESSITDLLSRFETKRMLLVSRLEGLDEEVQVFQSLHPRLKVLMRPVDMAFFTAEHDDHHLASIREIMNRIG